MLRFSRTCFALLVCALPASAQGPAPDLIPDDAAFALVVKNVEALKEKGEQFFKAHNVDPDRSPRPAQLFDQLFTFLQLKEGVDRKGAAALVLPNPEKLGLKLPPTDAFPVLFNLVVVVPITDADAVGKNFGFEKGKLVPGKTMPTGIATGWTVRVEGKHLLLSFTPKAVDVYAARKPVTKELSAAQTKALTGADAMLHFGGQTWGKAYDGMLDEFKKMLLLPTGDKSDTEVAESLVAALREVRFAVVALTLDETSSIDFVASFGQGASGAAALKFLRALRAGPGSSELLGLPNVAPLVAFAAKGDGEKNVHMARALLKGLFDKWLGIKIEISDADRKKFLAAFDVMYQHLKGSRSVVYLTDPTQAAKVGQSASLVILDVDNPEAHRTNWQNLVEVANNAAPLITKQDRKSSPKFSFKPKAETLDGHEVDWLLIDVPGIKKEVNDEYIKLLGPDWNKVRLVVVGKQVVGLFGSDLASLKQTIANLKTKAKGLPGTPLVEKGLARLSPERKIEMHFDLANYVPFLAGGKPVAAKDITSVALTIEEDRFQIEIKAAGGQLTEIVKLLGLAK